MNRLRVLLAICVLASPLSALADVIEHITVSPQAFAGGNTTHGYRELRVNLENRSPTRTTRVTLEYPANSYGRGHYIGRISRSVVLPPLARVSVSMWQPPLRCEGNNQFEVLLDGVKAGVVLSPEPGRHATGGSYGWGHSSAVSVVLVSRNLDFEAVGRTLRDETTVAKPYSAASATGKADSLGNTGVTSTAWTPDPGATGGHFIELQYNPPFTANRLRIFENSFLPAGAEAVLLSDSGTVIGRYPVPSGKSSGSPSVREISVSTNEPVKTVRLTFGPIYGSQIAIDAVELVLETNRVWATSATASSDASSSYAPSRSAPTLETVRSELSVSQWPDHWLSYTAFDGVVVGATELEAAPQAVADALWRYTEAGGHLIVVGASALPGIWGSRFDIAVAGEGIWRSVRVGFGRCSFLPADLITTDPMREMLSKALIEAAQQSAAKPDEMTANQNFPVIDNMRLPVRSTVVFMLGFVLLIGPVNMIVLSRMKRRIWLLWTVPAISFATTLVVFIYSFIREGVTPTVRTQSITLLNQAEHRATTLGLTALYCPLTPGGGLRFSTDTEVEPLVENNYFWNAPTVRREVDWSDGQRFTRGWVTARVPAHFKIRKSETRRERLQFEIVDGQPTVVNGLGATIESLWLADRSGAIFTGTNINAGARTVLVKSSEFSSLIERDGFPGLSDVRTLLNRAGGDTLNFRTTLRPGTYLARLNGDPFVENPLPKSKRPPKATHSSTVFGILESTPAP